MRSYRYKELRRRQIDRKEEDADANAEEGPTVTTCSRAELTR